LGFNPVAVAQQNNRQVTHITHKQRTTQYKDTIINDIATTHNTSSYNKYNKNYNKAFRGKWSWPQRGTIPALA
jgi:hypothetical protein